MTQAYSLRSGSVADGVAIVSVFRAARARMTYLPSLHTADDDRAFFEAELAHYDSDLALAGEEIVAFAIHGAGWLRHLYVSPAHQARGLGASMLERVKSRVAGGLELWTFESNSGARRFYERHGFILVENTDGSRNEEKLPDVRYEWLRARSDTPAS
jgi:putative acetyltransferase